MPSVYAPFLSEFPRSALQKTPEAIIGLLYETYGPALENALDPSQLIPSPLEGVQGTHWMRRANCVGVNVRTIGHFWNLIPYALTLPPAQQAIHILPIWEPGVVASLYGMSSWNINPAFFSPELARVFPQLDTVEKQLKVVINILHLTGRVVGMDVVPHTDRFSEQAIANPSLFEWMQRRGDRIVDHRADLFETVEQLVFEAFQHLSPENGYTSAHAFFYQTEEAVRLRELFGTPHDYHGRLARRKTIIQWLYEHGMETTPATMGPPYRGLEVDPDPASVVYDEEGRLWREYRITQPQPMSRVFGPLARYRLYESKDQNQNWALDFSKPVLSNWSYVCEHYAAVQRAYGFDFMRGDMSHVQMRPEGTPARPDAWYDLLGAVKQYCLKEKKWFAYFAESFMAAPGVMAYGDESDHLEASFADSTLGDLQSEPVGTPEFIAAFRRYLDTLHTRSFAPNFTIMTADKDDPRFDRFYLTGNEIRYFIALFLSEMPSYMSLGFECRDPHPTPAPNEHYTKLYVFQTHEGAKATQGPYQWGQNEDLYRRLVRQKEVSIAIWPLIEAAETRWLQKPGDGPGKTIAWQCAHFVFVANLDTEQSAPLPEWPEWPIREVFFSTHRENLRQPEGLLPGEGLILSVAH